MDIQTHAAELSGRSDLPPHPLHALIEQAAAAPDQATYEERYYAVFAALDALEATLGGQRFLGGRAPGGDDWALYAVLLRFDAIFYGLFKLTSSRP